MAPYTAYSDEVREDSVEGLQPGRIEVHDRVGRKKQCGRLAH